MDNRRIEVSKRLEKKKQSELGQFMTPSSIAWFMTSLFRDTTIRTAHLLDAGAGIGSLSAAFLDRWEDHKFSFEQVFETVYEVDNFLRSDLEANLVPYTKRLDFKIKVSSTDFIEAAAEAILFQVEPKYSHAILNPPYKKLASSSRHRRLLREIGIETVNLYSAFVALTIMLMSPGGQISVIIPRSFCNGPYYKPFRKFLLSRTAIRHIHLFESRSRAFKDDAVLQENVIFLLEVGMPQEGVTITVSPDATFENLSVLERSFKEIVNPDDDESFIHIPTQDGHSAINHHRRISSTLMDLGISVSTGPVVDFRLREYLRKDPEKGTAPLLYPAHFAGESPVWPKPNMKKSNALVVCDESRKWLYPSGIYTVTKRFTSKEERKRIVASVVLPSLFPDALLIGFENHLNVFHINKGGLPEYLALGLMVYLNSTIADMALRSFSGHTQVNATDLRLLKYPDEAVLDKLGKWAKRQKALPQNEIDTKVEELTK